MNFLNNRIEQNRIEKNKSNYGKRKSKLNPRNKTNKK